MTQRRKPKQQLEMTKTEIRTMYSQKKAAVRIHYTNLHERELKRADKEGDN